MAKLYISVDPVDETPIGARVTFTFKVLGAPSPVPHMAYEIQYGVPDTPYAAPDPSTATIIADVRAKAKEEAEKFATGNIPPGQIVIQGAPE